VRDGVRAQCAALKVNAVPLVDAWEFDDRQLKSVLGR
jgi:hypothetical protein